MKRYGVFDLVQKELLAIEAELICAIPSQVDLLTDIGSHLFLAGGKRLRPALYFLCARDGQKEMTKNMPVAVAIELIHTATLLHDDVLDSAAMRRGVPTVNARWGNHISVLAGDFLFAKAFDVIAGAAGTLALKVLTETICAICEGEISQIRDKFNLHQTEASYLDRTAKKTAGFIAASCRLGAVAAEFDDTTVEKLGNYGDALGMAFQIVDDLLDITASEEQIGKPVGNDLRQGILTLPVIYALQNSPRRDKLKKLIITQEITDAKIKESLAIIHETDAIDYSCQRVEEYLAIARDNIPDSMAADTKEALREVANFVVSPITAVSRACCSGQIKSAIQQVAGVASKLEGRKE